MNIHDRCEIKRMKEEEARRLDRSSSPAASQKSTAYSYSNDHCILLEYINDRMNSCKILLKFHKCRDSISRRKTVDEGHSDYIGHTSVRSFSLCPLVLYCPPSMHIHRINQHSSIVGVTHEDGLSSGERVNRRM